MEGSVRKIGILGGTFNPPHYGHICMALAALSEGGLDEVLWVPNGDPPHKMPEVSAADRLWMTRLAVSEALHRYGTDNTAAPEECSSGVTEEKQPASPMSVCELEIRRHGPSYMADTLREISDQYPGAKLYLICGGDMLPGLASWYRSDEIFQLADILAFYRQAFEQDPFAPDMAQTVRFLKQCGARITLLKTAVPDISSTKVRRLAARAALGLSESELQELSGLVPETVKDYILRHGIYQNSMD